MLKAVSSITNAIGALNYKGTWNASTNTPTLASGVGTKGDYYVVSVAGSTTLDGISNWGVGDWAAYNGSVWQRVEGGADGNFVNLSVSSTSTLSGLTASTALALDASKNMVSVTNTGTGSNVLANSPALVTPDLGTPTALVLTNASGTASININGTVGATTPTTGAFSTVTATGSIQGQASNAFKMNSSSGQYYHFDNATGNNFMGLSAANVVDLYAGSALSATFRSTGLAVTGALSSTLGATIQGLTVGLGAGAVSTNTAVGGSALSGNTTGYANTAVGNNALTATAGNYYLTGVGYYAGKLLSSGVMSTFLGAESGQALITGSNTTVVGARALKTATTSSHSVCLGAFAGAYETTDDAFYVDSRDRTNTAGDKANALLYGTFAASAASQSLRINAALTATGVVTFSNYGAGTATFSGAGVISSVSDETWKIKDGVPTNPDAMLKKLEPGYWYYNDEKKETFGADRQLGFYAQNVNAAIGPEAAPTPETITTKNQDGSETTVTKPWGYYDRSVLAITVMSLQKALATIETLTARITALETA